MANIGVKFDSEKPRYELLPAEALDALAQLYTFGAKKYGDRNWELGMKWSRLFGAIMRHAWDWMRGVTIDPETGQHQMIAVAWNAIALYVYSVRKTGQDDRPSSVATQGQEETTKTKSASQGPCDKEVSSKNYIVEAIYPQAKTYSHYYGVHE